MRRTVVLLFLTLFTGRQPVAAEDIRIFEGPENWAHPERIRLSETDILFDDPFTKLFGSRALHVLGRLDDGTQYVIDVFRWEYAFIGGWGLSVLVVQPDGRVYVFEKEVPETEVDVAGDRFHIRLGDSTLEGADGRYHVRIDLEGFSCHLQVLSLLPLWQPGDGYVYFTAERDVYMRLGVPCPWGLTQGYMIVDGRWLVASGQCYGDRSRHSYFISRMSSPTLAFRVFAPAEVDPEERWFLSVLQYTAHPDYGSVDIPVLILARGGEWVFTTKDFTLETGEFRTEERSGLAFPREYRLSAAADGYALQGRFVVTELYHLTDIFEELPRVFRSMVSMFFRRPVIFRMVGSFQGRVRLPDGSVRELYLPGQCEYSILD